MPPSAFWYPTGGSAVVDVAEDHEGNPGFTGNPGAALVELIALRLRWPADQRPALGAALHAKVVIVDSCVALITSANLTSERKPLSLSWEVGLGIGAGGWIV
jgi:phosphatidylserine/phosphatidylglycerophosphate/cardiolipin synthase-like enzyme